MRVVGRWGRWLKPDFFTLNNTLNSDAAPNNKQTFGGFLLFSEGSWYAGKQTGNKIIVFLVKNGAKLPVYIVLSNQTNLQMILEQ